MKRLLLALILLIAVGSSYSYDGKGCRESDHIICKKLGQWTVRHYFDSDTLRHRFSDANTNLELVDPSGAKHQVNFQINVDSEGKATLRIPGWITAIEINADQFKYRWSGEQVLHEFIDVVELPLLNAIANAKSKINIRLTYDQPPGIKEVIQRDGGISKINYAGTIDNYQSARALVWIRAINHKK